MIYDSGERFDSSVCLSVRLRIINTAVVYTKILFVYYACILYCNIITLFIFFFFISLARTRTHTHVQSYAADAHAHCGRAHVNRNVGGSTGRTARRRHSFKFTDCTHVTRASVVTSQYIGTVAHTNRAFRSFFAKTVQ